AGQGRAEARGRGLLSPKRAAAGRHRPNARNGSRLVARAFRRDAGLGLRLRARSPQLVELERDASCRLRPQSEDGRLVRAQPNVRTRFARALARSEALVERRLGLVVVFVLGLAVYAFEAIGWPLITGKDLDQYVLDYVQFLDWHPLLPWPMLFRTPVPGVIDGA